MHNTLSLLVYVGSQTNEIERNVKLRGRMKQRKISFDRQNTKDGRKGRKARKGKEKE